MKPALSDARSCPASILSCVELSTARRGFLIGLLVAGGIDAVCAGINIHPFAAQKTDKGLATVPRKLRGVAARRRNRGADRDAACKGFLRHLERRADAEHNMCWRSGKDPSTKPNRLNGRLAADATTRRRENMPGELLEVHRFRMFELHVDQIAGRPTNPRSSGRSSFSGDSVVDVDAPVAPVVRWS